MVTALDRPIAFQGNPVKQAAVPVIVVQRIVKRAPVVPDGDIADPPAKAALKFRPVSYTHLTLPTTWSV